MKVNSATFGGVDYPVYVLEEDRLRANLQLISDVAKEAGVEIILAFKAYALWKTFPIFREYINATTASSLWEAKLGYEEFGSKCHTFSPAYTDDIIKDVSICSSHITFNSISQYERFHTKVRESNPEISIGVRVNPEYSEVETLLYNPCAPGSRFGVTENKLPDILPDDIEGFHCHTLCESGPDVFQRTLVHIEKHFAKWFPQLKWVNFGGGHLMTRKGYDIETLVEAIKGFRSRHPHLEVILEPGSAFAWQTGFLLSTVEDIVENAGIKTAILNVSFACHMPDCLEMPYKPEIRGAHYEPVEGLPTYRMGGNSCLSGDYVGSWSFDKPLSVGDKIIFEDMIHYTTVKTTMFNGVTHPSIAIYDPCDGGLRVVRRYGYEDYRDRMG